MPIVSESVCSNRIRIYGNASTPGLSKGLPRSLLVAWMPEAAKFQGGLYSLDHLWTFDLQRWHSLWVTIACVLYRPPGFDPRPYLISLPWHDYFMTDVAVHV